MSKIIGFSGLAGSGKDTAADLLCSYDKSKYQKMSFGDAVKDVAAAAFGWPRDLLQGGTSESRAFREVPDEFWSKVLNKPFTPRLALQLIGTECFRNTIDNNFWIYVVQNRIMSEQDKEKTFLVTDVRFPNEVKMIHDLGGIVLRIKRGTLPNWYIDASNYNKQKAEGLTVELPKSLENIHVSETALAGLNLEDFVITNNGTFDDLLKAVLNHVER